MNKLLRRLASIRFRWLLLACSLPACGPALSEMVQLRQLADRATADCKEEPMKTKVARCDVALVCAQTAQEALKAIQSAQEARARAGATAGQEATAAGLYAAAIASCKAGGWR